MATKSTDPILTPLVAAGVAIVERCLEIDGRGNAKAAELKAISDERKAAEEELAKIDAQLIELGAGRYRDEADHAWTVVPGFPQTKSPDTFALPAVQLETARELAGDEFRKLFQRTEVYTPRNGFDALAELLLPPKKCRTLITLCLVEGKLAGGRSAYVRRK